MSLRTKLGIDLDVDPSGVNRGLNSTESKFGRLSGLGKKAGLAMAGGLGLAAAAGFKLAQSAAEDQLAATKLKTTIQNVTGATDKQVASVEKWITAQGKALGVTDDELRPALGRLVAATGSVSKAQKLASLAMDISAGTGKSLETVTTALAKAQNGSLGGLSRLGVATKDAAGNTLTLDQVTGKLAKTYDGAASAAANTAAGKFQRLKVQLGEMGENIGAVLLPAATSVLGWVNKMLPKGQALAGTIGEKVGPAFRAVAGFITDKVVPAGREVFRWYMEKIAPGLQRTLSPILDGIKSVFSKVTEKVRDNKESLGKLWDAAKRIAEFVANKLMPVFGDLAGDTLKVLGKAIGGAIDTIGFLIDKFSAAYNWVKNLISAIHDLGDALSSIKAGGKAGFLSGLGAALPGHPDLGGLFDRNAAIPRLGTTSTPGAVVNHNYYSVTIPGTVLDPAGAARAIKQLLQDDSLRNGTALAFGTPS